MLFYCDTRINKVLKEVEQDSEIYKYVSKLFSALHLERRYTHIDKIPFHLIFAIDEVGDEYLCRMYDHGCGPVIMSKTTFEDFKTDKKKLFEDYDWSRSRNYFESVTCEIYQVLSDRLALRLILTANEESQEDCHYGAYWYIDFFESLKSDCYFEYHTNIGTGHFDFEKTDLLFFYDYNNTLVDTFEYYSDGVYNKNLLFKEETKVKCNKSVDENELKTDSLVFDSMSLLSKLQEKEIQINKKEQDLKEYEDKLVQREKALLDQETKLEEMKRFIRNLLESP